MSHEQVQNEIDNIILSKTDAGDPLFADWIANEVCQNHVSGLARGADGELWRWAGYSHIRAMTKLRINKFSGGTKAELEDDHPTLPGFSHLYSYYTVVRDDERVGVSVHNLTDDELLGRADEYDAAIRTLSAHSREIRRFVAERKAAREVAGESA